MQFKHLVACLLTSFATVASAADFSVVRRYAYPIISTRASTGTIVSSGSGIIIKDGYVITAGHVVGGRATHYIINEGMKPATVIKTDNNNDLALLQVPGLKCPCATIASEASFLDEPSYTVGFPMYLGYKVQTVTIGTVQGLSAGYLVTSSHTTSGGSGGGIFVKENNDYKLAALTNSVASVSIGGPMMNLEQQLTWMVFGTRASVIKQFLAGTPAAVK